MIIVTSLNKNSQGPSQQVNPSASTHTFSTFLTRITGVNNANNNNSNDNNNNNNINNNSGEILTEAQFYIYMRRFFASDFPTGSLWNFELFRVAKR